MNSFENAWNLLKTLVHTSPITTSADLKSKF